MLERAVFCTNHAHVLLDHSVMGAAAAVHFVVAA